jgi:glucose-6-phosphate 1-dehydrogenase
MGRKFLSYNAIMNNNDSLTLYPTIFVIFGITGDLASRKLLPALLSLYSKRLLPIRFTVIGFSRRSFNKEEFRDLIRNKMNIRPGQFKEEDIKHFLDHMSYEQGYFDDSRAYERLSKRIQSIDHEWDQCSNKIFHLSVPPSFYAGILTNLSSSKLNHTCNDESGWTRILIEKPFGSDIKEAKALDNLLGKLFDEKQIFRIDHYLAKEALQNILAFRFSNSLFESVWNNRSISRVHIKLFEKIGIEGRGDLYESLGALKDMGQNHMLAMLALITMDRPKSFIAGNIRDERAKVLSTLSTISPRNLERFVSRGQYDGYLAEKGVASNSRVETYFRIEARLNNKNWKGVPFYLENGKAMRETKTEIDVYFKGSKNIEEQNILTFRIQPEECIKIRFFVKTPGFAWEREAKTLKFKYSDIPSFTSLPNDYERLIHDAFIGDQTLFASTDEIMASWKFVTPIIENWNRLPLKKYPKGAIEVE